MLVCGELLKEDFFRLFILDELAHFLGQLGLFHLFAKLNADFKTLLEVQHVHVAEYFLSEAISYALSDGVDADLVQFSLTTLYLIHV